MGRRKKLPADFDGNWTEEMLSERQRSILKYIRAVLTEKGYPPSVREIGRACGLSSSASVHNQLKFLENTGFISRVRQRPRALDLIGYNDAWRNKAMVPVPLVGRVTAGIPILAVENIEETYPIPKDFIGVEEDVFMLRVCGDSMINAGILDGDYIIARKQNYANNGEIIVALIDNEETTVKRYFRELRQIRLQPENPKYEPITGTDNIKIIGKVISVIRLL
ncbi:MAG: transcriptional repressor LexA [Phascolarctobacterium sp.]|nr:transcriptional repressor LexA [Phascolarctobacterium sp.]